MSNVVAMGLPGPAPAAGGANAPPQAGAASEAGSFGRALQARGTDNPTSESQGIRPPGQDPGPLDIQAVIQALLGDGAEFEGQTENTGRTQLDRLAEVGTAGADEPSEIPVDGLPFVALTQQQAPQMDDEVHLSGRALAATKAAHGSPVAGDAVRPMVLGGDLPATASPVATAARAAARGEVAPAVLQAVSERQALKAQATEMPVAAPTPTSEPLPAVSTAEVAVEVTVPPEPTAEIAAESTVEPAMPELDAPETLPEPEAPVTESLELAAAEVEGAGDAPADAPDVMPPPTSVLQPMSRSAATTVEAGVSEVPVSGAFASDLAGTVRRATLVGDNELRLLLNPPELGHVDVRIIDSPNGLRVVMEAASAEARELIEQQLPALRAALEARDLRIDRVQVERSAEALAEDALGRGSRDELSNQSGNPGNANQGDGSGHEDAPWSPVAAMRSDGTPSEGETPAGSSEQSIEAIEARGSAAGGRLDVLA